MVKLTYFRYISERSFSLQVETAYLMDCNISDKFKTKSTATLGRKILPSLNDSFELSAHDISLVSNIKIIILT